MNIQTPVATIYGNWKEKYGSVWAEVLEQLVTLLLALPVVKAETVILGRLLQQPMVVVVAVAIH